MRPMLLSHHPGFQCPLCRTFADLESDVEVEGIDGYLNLAEGGVPMPSIMEEKSVSVPAPSSLAPASSSVQHPARTPIPAVVELTDDNASELNRSSVIPELEPGTRASGSGSGSASGTPSGAGAGTAGAGAPGTAVGPTFFGAAAATPVSDSRIDDAGVLAAVGGYHPTYGHEGADFELDADAMGEAEEEEEVDELEEHEGDEMVTSEAEREAAASTYEPTHTRSVHARYAATPSTSSGTVRRQQRHARSAGTGTGNGDATFITGVVDDVELEEDPASSLAARRLRRAMGDDGDEEAEVEEEVRGGAG
ncbi:hypothetical protein DL93DRAFT_495947 [Clavulina sp. PMI_390]|nr:hypothetical protein DL93DRAFT_495947 [Clavulina sp. PMI_390]